MVVNLESGDRLLSAWLNLTSKLWNRRIVTTMPYNEAHILGLLLGNRNVGKLSLTATDLIKSTHLLKSQMNRLLTSLEEKGFIQRVRSQTDRRSVNIFLTKEGEEAYRIAHADVDIILTQLLDRIGDSRAQSIAQEINEVVSVLDEILKENCEMSTDGKKGK